MVIQNLITKVFLIVVLLLDIARFKYTPHWVCLDKLYESVNTYSKEQISRGFLFCFNKIEPDLQFYSSEISDNNERLIPNNRTNFEFVNSPKDFQDMKHFISNYDSVSKVHEVEEIPEFYIRLCISYLVSKEWMTNTNNQVNDYYKSKYK